MELSPGDPHNLFEPLDASIDSKKLNKRLQAFIERDQLPSAKYPKHIFINRQYNPQRRNNYVGGDLRRGSNDLYE